MVKRGLLAFVVTFIVWSILDFIIHGVLLQRVYEATSNLWRPMEQMNFVLMYFVTLVFVVCFVAIYAFLVQKKSLRAGTAFGALFGIGTGMSMGFGSYTAMPIPLTLAWGWFLGTLVEAVAAGVIVGAIVKAPRDVHSAG